LRDTADAKSHEATLECERLHILLTDFKSRAELKEKTSLTTEKDLRDKIEVLRDDMQSLRVSAMEAAAATAEEVSRGHEVRQRLIGDLNQREARVAELENENRELMNATLQQDRLLNQSVNESIDLSHRVMENDITLASINERQKNEINEMNESMEIQAETIRSSVEDIERQIAEKFMNETEDLQSKLEELEKANKLLEFEKKEFLEDMQSTIETVGQMESRLTSLIEENSALKLEISKSDEKLIDKKIVFPDNSLKHITNLESGIATGSQSERDVMTSADKALVKISGALTRPRGKVGPPVVGRLERLEKFITTLQARQDTPPENSDKQVVFNIEALLSCLLSIKQESEEMVVHTSTVATTSLLRQLRHRKSNSDKKSSASFVSTPPRADHNKEGDVVNVSDLTQHQQHQLGSAKKSSTSRKFPGNVVLNNRSDSDSDEDDLFYEDFEVKKHLERHFSDKSLTGAKQRQSPAELFTQMDSTGDGFISLPVFIKAVRKYEHIGKVLTSCHQNLINFLFDLNLNLI
jgi:hypothetical protein